MRIPIWTLQLVGLLASATVVVAVGWFLLALLTSMAQYIPTLP